MKSTAAFATLASLTLTACASASGDDDLMASPSIAAPMHATGLDAAVDAARQAEGNVDAGTPRRDPVPALLPDAATPAPDAAPPALPINADPPPQPVDAGSVDSGSPTLPAVPTWRPLGRASRRAAVGCCSVTTTQGFNCTAATIGTELRIGADAQRKSSIGELSEYGWLQGTAVSFNGSFATISGRSSCGCDTVVTLLSEAYVCTY
jgi:hypothetical protein